MKTEERLQLFRDVFAPKPGENVLILVDMPHDEVRDSERWKARRDMAQEWYVNFKDMGSDMGFTVEMHRYDATGMHNALLPQRIIDVVRRVNLVIAITEYSASSSLIRVCNAKDTKTRCASMPLAEKRMEKTAFKADYEEVQRYAKAIACMLNDACGAEITFSTGDSLYIDLRYRTAHSEAGECTKAGQFINFPSGEAWKAPYEATPEEVEKYGESKTEGVMPMDCEGELVRFIIQGNRIVEIVGDGEKKDEMQAVFTENDTRRNIAELGVGCNPMAVVTGNPLEDEKVEGLHIGYAMSTHLGGNVESDMHMDIIYAKGCPVEATTLRLVNSDGSKTEVIRDAALQYAYLKRRA